MKQVSPESPRTQIANSSMRGLSSISLIRIVSSTPSRLRYHIFVGEAQNIEPLRNQRSRAGGVAGDLFIRRVRRPVDFDDHPRLEAGEVGNERAENNLPPKSKSCACVLPKTLPKASLGVGCVATQSSRERRQ